MKKRFKVAIICDAGFNTGTFYYAIRLAEELSSLGCDVSLVTPVRLSDVKAKQVVLKSVLFKLPFAGRPYWLLSLYRRLRKYDFDIIHSFGYGIMNLLPFDIYKHTLKVTSISDVICDNKEMRGKSFAMWFIVKFLQPPHIRFNDLLIISTQYTRGEMVRIRKAPAEKLRVSHLGVAENFGKIKNKSVLDKARKRLNLPDKFIINTGGIKISKNIVNMIKAFKIISRQHPDVHLVFSGKLNTSSHAPDYHKKVYHEIMKLDKEAQEKFHFLSFVSEKDLEALYNLAALLFMPSLEEGFGLPMLEAMRSGIPVVTSNVSCMPEVAGGAALLCSPYEPKDMARKVDMVLRSKQLADSLVNKGLKRVKNFTWKQTAKRAYAFYQEAWKKKFG